MSKETETSWVCKKPVPSGRPGVKRVKRDLGGALPEEALAVTSHRKLLLREGCAQAWAILGGGGAPLPLVILGPA